MPISIFQYIVDILHVSTNRIHTFQIHAQDQEYAMYKGVAEAREAGIKGLIRINKIKLYKGRS
jgi:hypothetical protein